ncbi:hypothetical protein RchiOBHm_Chr1g0325981 [Rosa chinensis]|uniref:Uncharacterized protein n=1 Tax=Rosa chinensis TaxID=74649 RepID=A0A2P6SA50_ROSCH|nr:hypothetical protein RchiOBHm_Chr1g0325981 [Rosa chinensis]
MNDHICLNAGADHHEGWSFMNERTLFMNSLSFVDSKHSGPCISLLRKTGTVRVRCIPEHRLWSLNSCWTCFSDFFSSLCVFCFNVATFI